ncbi:MAG: hypothetical protein U1D30_08700 [Planctomycetota bacterium]
MAITFAMVSSGGQEFGRFFIRLHIYEIEGLNNQYSTYGLGVPLIAVPAICRAFAETGRNTISSS